MEIIYKTKDGKEFSDKEKAEAWEELERETIKVVTVSEIKVIPLSEFKKLSSLGDILNLTIVYRDDDGEIEEDSGYEINKFDEEGHLDCSDLNHGLIEWSDKEQAYFRARYGRSWKIDILGVKDVSYW